MTKFKVGDKVKLVKGSEYYDQAPNKVGVIIEALNSDGWYKVKFPDHREDSYRKKDLISTTKQKPLNFMLQYELDEDPIERFGTLLEAKKRVKELLSDQSLKRDSMYIHEIKNTYKVEVKESIVVKLEK